MFRLPDRLIGFVIGGNEDNPRQDVRVSGEGRGEFLSAIELRRVYPKHVIEIDSDPDQRAVYLRTVRTPSDGSVHIFTSLSDNKFGRAFSAFCINEIGRWVVIGRMHVETWERRERVRVLNKRVEELAFNQ